jgi:hypothetical protein
MAQPNYIIIGTHRGGSTSLHNYIRAHPQVAEIGGPRFEMHLFDYPHNWQKGLQWYEKQFDGFDGQLCGEKSPTYLDHPLVPRRIKEHYPDVKLIVILRNPVDRAYSAYNKVRAKGLENFSTFEKALDAEPDRLKSELGKDGFWENDYYVSHHCSRAYTWRGMYAEHLKRWLLYFRPSQMLILKSEDMFADPQRAALHAWDFLGLSPVYLTEPKRWQKIDYEPMLPETRERLKRLYVGPNAELAAMLGGDERWLWESVDGIEVSVKAGEYSIARTNLGD